MKLFRHILTAAAAAVPCRASAAPEPYPNFCDCGERFVAAARGWDNGLITHYNRVGPLRYSPQIGTA